MVSSLNLDPVLENLDLWQKSCLTQAVHDLEKQCQNAQLIAPIKNSITHANYNLTAISNAAKAAFDESEDAQLRLLFARVIYICDRSGSLGQKLFFDAIMHKNRRSIKFDRSNTTNYKMIPKLIRQCRPDKPKFSKSAAGLVGFSRYNRDYQYDCFDQNMAAEFLRKEFSADIEELFHKIRIPQAKSDFFLLASFLKLGGISADVCSVARSSIEPLLSGYYDYAFVYDANGIRKHFLAGKAESSLIKRHLQRVIDYISREDASYEHEQYQNVFGDPALTRTFLDCLAEEISYLEKNKINLISEEDYRIIVEPSMEEEDISSTEQGGLRKTSLASLVDAYGLTRKKFTRIGCIPPAFVPKYRDVDIIGHDAIPAIANQLRMSVMAAEVGVYQIQELDVSGHSCIWQDGQLVDFNSYLSKEMEIEIRGGFWKRPGSEPDITLEDPTLVAFSPGYACYGHYLVDDLPRMGLAKHFLGDEAFSTIKILMPRATPGWAVNLITTVLNVTREQFVFFEHTSELVRVKNAIVPEFFHRHYIFNPYLKEFYNSVSPASPKAPFRKICLSRKAWEVHKANQRIFVNQAEFEDQAAARGFSIVCPETLSIREQMTLMSETICQIGEHGSAQHSSVFNARGTVVGTINPLGEVQANLGRLYNDLNVIVYADSTRVDENNNTFYSVSSEKIHKFFDAIERNIEIKSINN